MPERKKNYTVGYVVLLAIWYSQISCENISLSYSVYYAYYHF